MSLVQNRPCRQWVPASRLTAQWRMHPPTHFWSSESRRASTEPDLRHGMLSEVIYRAAYCEFRIFRTVCRTRPGSHRA